MPTRSLRPEEITEARWVFDGGLDYARCRVAEGSDFPNFIGRVGAFFRGAKPPEANAVTVRDTTYFPRALTTDKPDDPLWLTDIGWLMHELTHQWQYQHDGLRYLIEAIFAPTYVYTQPGERPNDALKRASQAGKKFRDFNREQQGDIARDYYWSLRIEGADADRSGWAPYLIELRTPPGK
jgi:hypothetical protein